MKTFERARGTAAFALVLALAACSGASAPVATPARPGPTASTASQLPGETRAAGAQLEQAWATAKLVNVSTGESFRIADLAASGKVVFLETMAIWCTNCRLQQREAATAFEALDSERAVWIAIDVESSESAEALARYREQNGFPFTYVIADAELSRALVADFGDVVLSPPSVNIVVIGTDGRVAAMRGHRGADEIRQLAADFGA